MIGVIKKKRKIKAGVIEFEKKRKIKAGLIEFEKNKKGKRNPASRTGQATLGKRREHQGKYR